jgi:hypothetical protein
MCDIAPTLAGLLGIELRTAAGRAVVHTSRVAADK